MSLIGTTLDVLVGSGVGRRAVRAGLRASLLGAPPEAAVARGSWAGHLLSGRGFPADAATALRLAERRAGAPEAREVLAARRALAQLAAGQVPADLPDRVTGSLAVADAALDRGHLDAAADRLVEALALAYHPSRHFGAHRSPLLADPDAFLAPFRASRAVELLTATPRPRPRRPRRRTERLLVVAAGNFTFVRDIVADYRRTDGLTVRTLDLDADPALGAQLEVRALTRARLRRGVAGERLPVPAHLRETFTWADTVLVEWGHRALAWLSLLDEVGARVVARVHRYEALTSLPLLTDWSGVDDVIFVSPDFRDVVRRAAPAVDQARVSVVPNHADLTACRQDKTPAAARTCALVGWDRLVKDPAWALDVLDRLRRADPRWRLLLIGSADPAEPWPEAREYYARLRARLAALGPAVEVRGFTDDVPGALRDVGVVLSTSRQESAHLALLQGAASGALPVVRDWPDLAGWGGPAAQYPAEWVVATPAQAADRIRAAGERPHESAAARAAQEWVLAHRDWSTVRPAFDAVVLGTGVAG
ncbi:glycosyltransferase [Georgenia sp. TF02-10]|uniref:glycosyltransferase n=1 Tax=Georgenia sp. TF02-10 TaxID=2917725 RepID=UPI001FA72692|nr:glycosyltransferase [Georgenia sp. TF02-10]UNX55731.1 glycosyltransferase [Georgenia sp. TF02-10]